MEIFVNFIEVGKKPGFADSLGEKTRQTLLDAGVKSVKGVKVIQVWLIFGGILHRYDLEMLATELFADSVTDQFRINRSLVLRSKCQQIVGVAYNPGIAYSTNDTAKKAIRDLGIEWILDIRNGQKYVIQGYITDEELKIIHENLVSHQIQHFVKDWAKELTEELTDCDEMVLPSGKRVRLG